MTVQGRIAMILTALFLLQQSLPDIQLNARVRAREVTIERQGEAKLTVTTSPEDGNLVDVRAPRAERRRTLRNVEVQVRAEGRIADPGQPARKNPDTPETGTRR